MPGIYYHVLKTQLHNLEEAIIEYKKQIMKQRVNFENKAPVDYSKMVYWRNSIAQAMFIIEDAVKHMYSKSK